MTSKKLGQEELYHSYDLSQLDFETTASLPSLEEPLGQQRALEAIEFGIDMQNNSFNLFVHGESGLGKRQLVSQIISNKASVEKPPADWCYVNNFENPQKPKLLKLPAGMGRKLRKDMESLVEDMLTALPSSFQSEEYRNRRQEIEDEFQERQDHDFKKLNDEAIERGITIKRTPTGYALGPEVDGKVYGAEDFNKLPKDERERIEKLIADIQLELKKIISDLPLLQREHYQRTKALNREFTQHTVEQLIAWIENNYREQPKIIEYLDDVKKNAIENMEDFLPSTESPETKNLTTLVATFREYSINVIVDNTDTVGAPVIFESNPTYQNILGRTEYVSEMGTLLTDFTLIKSGALLKANGGYLILDAQKVLTHAFAWEGLKRAIKSREIRIESFESMLSMANTVSLEPECIPLNVKVIMTGEPTLYYLLKEYDREFSELFKVAADFSSTTIRTPQNTLLYARLVAAIQKKNNNRPLTARGVGRVIEHASRLADDSEKLSLHIDSISDLLQEADYWSGKGENNKIDLKDIEKAIRKQRYRQDKYREQMLEQITRNFKLIDCTGKKVAQLNALSVLQVGDYAFGQPSRITATARLGHGAIIDIERAAKLGGQLHSKGVMILSSYLASRFAPDRPLPLSASLVFEQSYGKVDGDSASAAELCVLLSALGNIPLKQSIALTGSINQFGEVQAIGGVNEKIEGFFDLCLARGLSGDQGVIIPQANQVHLMLRKELREAVSKKQFHIFTVQSIDDIMELLSGLSRGKVNREGRFSKKSFNSKIQLRIEELQKLQKRFFKESADDEPGQRSNSEEK